jgi:hypothetical protein
MASTTCDTSRTAPPKEITIDLVWIRIITGDVARLAGLYDKATGAHEGTKEGKNQ